MSAYIVANITEMLNPEILKEYSVKNGPLLEEHGGKVISAGQPEIMEGDPAALRAVVIEFGDKDAAKAWYNSDAYQEIIPLRQQGCRSTMILMDGA